MEARSQTGVLPSFAIEFRNIGGYVMIYVSLSLAVMP